MFAVINKVYIQVFYVSMVWSFIHSFIPFLNNKKNSYSIWPPRLFSFYSCNLDHHNRNNRLHQNHHSSVYWYCKEFSKKVLNQILSLFWQYIWFEHINIFHGINITIWLEHKFLQLTWFFIYKKYKTVSWVYL